MWDDSKRSRVYSYATYYFQTKFCLKMAFAQYHSQEITAKVYIVV